MDGGIDQWIDGQTDEWLDGWVECMDGCKDGWSENQVLKPI